MLFLPFVASAVLAASVNTDSVNADLDQPVLLTNAVLAAEPAPTQEEEEEEPVGIFFGQVTIGGTYTEGNTERRTASVAIDAIKNYKNTDRLTLGFNWNFNQQEDANGSSIARRIEGRAKYDISIDDRSYVWLNAFAQTDKPIDDTLPTLDLRYSAGVGYGYRVLDNDVWKWGLEAGLAFFNEEYQDQDEDDYLSARIASISSWQYSENTSFSNYIELYPSLDESDDVYGRSDTRATTNLTESMIGQLQWIWDYDNTPAADRDRSDHLFLVTVGWGF